ncbi:MAG: TonB-dependent receptor [Bacteroidales bacterium]|nr:TonB-dependent receptor [Bacteroidales bacterium]
MKMPSRSYILLFFFTFFFFQLTYAQKGITISGKVISSADNEPLIGVNIIIKDKTIGTATDNEGNFFLKADVELPVIIRFSIVGFASKEITVSRPVLSNLRILMDETIIMSKEVIITAPLIEKKIFRAPVTIEKMNMLDIRQAPVSTFYDALANLRGVDVATQGLQFKSINTRGFNSTGNVRFVQLIDGMDNQAPGLNFPVGNIAGISELDLESLELLPGPSSALYGPNALNGLLLMNSKDPFKYQGLSASAKGMVNNLGFGSTRLFEFNLDPIFEGAIRYAKATNEHFAFKLNISFMRGEDWHADEFKNVHKTTDPDQIKITEKIETFPAGTDPTIIDPGYDGLNLYGDEILTTLPVGPYGSNLDVARTGYAEEDLVNYNTKNIKVSGAVHYKLSSGTRAILQGNYGIATTMYTGDNRISLNNFGIFQGKAEVIGDNFFIRGYTTWQNSGNSYDAGNLAVNLNRIWKNDEEWFRHYKMAYTGHPALGLNGGSHEEARKFADSGFGRDNSDRAEPGTPEFEYEKYRIKNLADFREGAKIINNSGLYHIEGKYDFSDAIKFLDFQIGGNYRLYDLNSAGTLFADTAGNDITNYEFGLYSEISKTLFQDNVQFVASLRYDKNENFYGSFSPRFSAVYTLNNMHNFRFSLQSGSRFPNTKEQFINKDLGVARIIGGLPGLINSYDLIGNSFFLQDINAFKNAVSIDSDEDNPERYNLDQAIIKNLPLLEKGIVKEDHLAEYKPETIRSIELVYKLNITGKLFLDATYYRSLYKNFIGLKRLVKPRTVPSIDIYDAATQIFNTTQHDVFYINSNSKTNITVQGFTLGFKYIYLERTVINSNFTWSKLTTKVDDPIVPGFNTPEFKANVSFSQQEFLKNFSYNINWRWQNAFDWQSPFGDGKINQFNTLDMQGSYKFERFNTVLKVGVTNFFNFGYVNTYGGPVITALYYFALNFDQIFK